MVKEKTIQKIRTGLIGALIGVLACIGVIVVSGYTGYNPAAGDTSVLENEVALLKFENKSLLEEIEAYEVAIRSAAEALADTVEDLGKCITLFDSCIEEIKKCYGTEDTEEEPVENIGEEPTKYEL